MSSDDDDDDDDDDGQACDTYRIDMTASTFGACKCGYPKSAHNQTTKAGAYATKIVSCIEEGGKTKPSGGNAPWQPKPATLLQKKAAAEEAEVSWPSE